MIYNEKISQEYGKTSLISTGVEIYPYKPTPTSTDYASGIIRRVFVKKVNDPKAIEINPEQESLVNKDLYQIVSIDWKISGSKSSHKINGIIEKTGIVENNEVEISHVKLDSGVDLSLVLPNLLEFWRGF